MQLNELLQLRLIGGLIMDFIDDNRAQKIRKSRRKEGNPSPSHPNRRSRCPGRWKANTGEHRATLGENVKNATNRSRHICVFSY